MDKLSWKGLVLFSCMSASTISYAVSGAYQTTYSSFQMRANSLYNIDMPLKN